MSTETAPKTPLNTSKIDQMIKDAAAKRKDQDAKGAEAAETAQALQREAKEARERAKKAREAEKAERDAKKAQDKAARAERREARKLASAEKKQKRDAERAARQAKRAKRSPQLAESAQSAYDAAQSLSPNDMMNLAEALATAAKAALAKASATMSDRAEPGDEVEVLSGQHAGKKGVVKQAAPRRARVAIGDREAYLFTAQLRVTTPEKQ